MKSQRQAKIMEIISNRNVETQEQLLEQLKQDVPTESYPLRKLAGNIGEDAMGELLTVQSILRPASTHAESRTLFEKILADGDCLTLKTLLISGKDLMAMGAPHGKELGKINNKSNKTHKSFWVYLYDSLPHRLGKSCAD